jgi:hypothetical protein
MSQDELTSLYRWYPISIKEVNPSVEITWRFFGDHRFTEPFFGESYPPTQISARVDLRTNSTALTQFDTIDGVQPTAFIFHASRCGSTLVSQLLATLPQCIVISEAPAIDDALKLAHPSNPSDSDGGMELLKRVVRCFGQRRFQDEQHLFIKLDSWQITALPLLRHAFPTTPLVFIYRNPYEILASHRRQRGMQMVPGLLAPDLLGLENATINANDLDGYCLNVLTSFFRCARIYAQTHDLFLIHYSQLPDFVWTQFAQFFSIPLSLQDTQVMQDRATRHAKHPVAQFTPDGHAEDNQTDIISHSRLDNVYKDLEQLRRGQHWFWSSL